MEGMLLRSFCVWAVIILTEIVHGTFRVIFLQPILGDFRARQISVFTGSLLILLIATAFSNWVRATKRKQLIFIGLLWSVLTLCFEVILGRFILGFSWERIGSDYNIFQGGLLPLGIFVLIFAPLFAAKLRGLIYQFKTHKVN